MTAGITVYNDNNTVQIDETYRNMVLLKSGQFTANRAATNQDLWWLSNQDVWTKTSPHAILAVRHPYPGLVLGPGSYREGRKVCNFFYPPDDTVTFQYYIFDLVGPALSDRVGMQVFDGNSNLIYSAYDFPLRVVQALNTDDATGQTSYIWQAPHTNIAVSAVAGGYYLDSDGIEWESWYSRTYWDGLFLRGYSVTYTNPGGENDPQGQWGTTSQELLMIDVSNVPLNYLRP